MCNCASCHVLSTHSTSCMGIIPHVHIHTTHILHHSTRSPLLIPSTHALHPCPGAHHWYEYSTSHATCVYVNVMCPGAGLVRRIRGADHGIRRTFRYIADTHRKCGRRSLAGEWNIANLYMVRRFQCKLCI